MEISEDLSVKIFKRGYILHIICNVLEGNSLLKYNSTNQILP